MGYDTYFNVNITAPNKKEHNAVKKAIAKAAFNDIRPSSVAAVEDGFEAHWYDCEEDLKNIAKEHPDVLIEVTGDGESSDDIWSARYKGDKSEKVQYEGLPDFKEILTEQEAASEYEKIRLRYRDVLTDLRHAAVRRIRAVKARITGGEDRYLSIEKLNEKFPQLTISCTPPCVSSRTKEARLVTGFHDDGETLSTEDGDPIDLCDMIPDQIEDVVSCIEDLEKDLERGIITGRWDEDEEIFELCYSESA